MIRSQLRFLLFLLCLSGIAHPYSLHGQSTANSGQSYVDAFDINNEYNYSNIDQRHQFAASGMVYMPAGFEVGSFMRFNTGRPFSPATGVDSNNDGIVRDRPVLDGKIVPRNTYRNLGFADVSMRLQKHFALPNEKGRVSVSAELFNVFDFDNVEIGSGNFTYGPNLGIPTTNLNFGKTKDAAGKYLASSTLRTSPFQLQLGLRFQF